MALVQRWWQRPSDGVVFMMTDPDHIARLIQDGWREVTHPSAPVLPVSANSSGESSDAGASDTPDVALPTEDEMNAFRARKASARGKAERA